MNKISLNNISFAKVIHLGIREGEKEEKESIFTSNGCRMVE